MPFFISVSLSEFLHTRVLRSSARQVRRQLSVTFAAFLRKKFRFSLCRYRTSKSNALEAGARPAARRVELNYAAAAALAAESHHEQRPSMPANALENAHRDAARLEAAEAASAREWTRRLIESGCGTARDDDDDSDLDPHQWGGDIEIIDDKVILGLCGCVLCVTNFYCAGCYSVSQRPRKRRSSAAACMRI